MTFDDIERLTGIIEAGTSHVSKESLVAALGEIGNGGRIKPFLSLPSCCKSESDQFETMIASVFQFLMCDIVATDGDAMRRKTFIKMLKPVSDQVVKCKLKALPLFDLHVINGEKALYFDDKHCAKRFRGVLVSESRGC